MENLCPYKLCSVTVHHVCAAFTDYRQKNVLAWECRRWTERRSKKCGEYCLSFWCPHRLNVHFPNCATLSSKRARHFVNSYRGEPQIMFNFSVDLVSKCFLFRHSVLAFNILAAQPVNGINHIRLVNKCLIGDAGSNHWQVHKPCKYWLLVITWYYNTYIKP